MGIGAAIGGVASLAGGLIGGNAASSAAGQQASAANDATAAQQAMFNTIQGNMQPYMAQGKTSLGQLGQYMNASETGGPGGQPGLLHQFGAQDLQNNMAPNYQFQLSQGLGANQNMAAAGGGALGGNALEGMQSFAQNTAQNAYQNAYNNYNNNQNNIYSRLGNLAQLGQASGTNSALGGSAFAGGMANTIVGAGNANAAGTMGTANAISGGLNNAAGYYMMGNMFKPTSTTTQPASGYSGYAGPADASGNYASPIQ